MTRARMFSIATIGLCAFLLIAPVTLVPAEERSSRRSHLRVRARN